MTTTRGYAIPLFCTHIGWRKDSTSCSTPSRHWRSKGRLTEREVADILCDREIDDNDGHRLTYPRDKARLIVDAMREFKICYRLPGDEQTLILPDLLPSDRPAELRFNRAAAMRFDFDFGGFLPRHLMTMFTVQRHEEIVDGLVWQNGVRLRSPDLPGTEALAEADYHQRRFSLWVSSPHAGRYFAALQDEVLKILKRMEKLRFTEWLWLPDAARIEDGPLRLEGDELPRARFRDLIAMEARRMGQYVCAGGVYDLARVLGNIPRSASGEAGAVTHNHFYQEVNSVSNGDHIEMSGDFRNAIVNVSSTLQAVTQSVERMPTRTRKQKDDLKALVAKLDKALQDAIQKGSTEEREYAELVAERVQDLTTKAAAGKSKGLLEVSAKGLMEAAEFVHGFAPLAWEAAKGIAEVVVS